MTATFRLGLAGILSTAWLAGASAQTAAAGDRSDDQPWRVAQAQPKSDSDEDPRRKQQQKGNGERHERRDDRGGERRERGQQSPGSGQMQGQPRGTSQPYQLPSQQQGEGKTFRREVQPQQPGEGKTFRKEGQPQQYEGGKIFRKEVQPQQPGDGKSFRKEGQPQTFPQKGEQSKDAREEQGQKRLDQKLEPRDLKAQPYDQRRELKTGERDWSRDRFRRLDDVKQLRRERVEDGGRRKIIEEPGRLIVREQGRVIIRHDETDRFRRKFGDARTERLRDGSTSTTFLRPDGVRVVSVFDSHGRLLHRYRRHRDGRIIVLIDNRRWARPGLAGLFLGGYIALAPPIIRIPREKYIVEYDDASYDDLYEALTAPPVEDLDREYSLDEILQSQYLRERMRRIDIDINFEFGSWEVDPSQYRKLERLASVINRILERNPDEMVMLEGHTDAVGSDEDNATLSDRRVEAVAIILSDTFGVPPENLVTQGYGEQFLKIDTPGPEPRNRRVVARRITPLLSRRER